ncbi:hypothetical protein LCGC14_2154900 [marine sediment metagenome]|uniref:Putative regulatory protein FmdB zinc ribbon domain-containing protein n=1 Tax=marine sediment metagenome TaxID=412755 RepID=A0A0F9DUN5_9ZZZZ
MPIYLYECEPCGEKAEVLQPMGARELDCPECEMPMVKQPTCQALVLMKGNPSFRKRYLGTAPYTTRVTPREKVKGGPGAKDPRSVIEGEKWLESLA